MWMWPLSLNIAYCANLMTFYFSTKHKSGTVTTTRAVWGATAKLARISFSFFKSSGTKVAFLPEILADSVTIFSFLKWRTFSSSLGGSTLRFLFGVSDCQYHYSGFLGPLLRKIRVTWTQALQEGNSPPDNQGVYWVTDGRCPGGGDKSQAARHREISSGHSEGPPT